MKKKHQFVLVLGIINVILPVIPILAHRGLFGMVENGWKFIWVAAIMILLVYEKKNGINEILCFCSLNITMGF